MWGKHPRLKTLKDKRLHGCKYLEENLVKDVRLLDLKGSLSKGNHKLAKQIEDHLGKAMKIDVQKRWDLILPEETALNTPDLELAPMGVAEHFSINPLGKYVRKQRVAHDYYFPGVW